MRKNLEFVISEIIRREVRPGHEVDGDLHADPADPGGTTKFGISQFYHPKVNVAKLTRSEAMDIYEKEYWNAMKADDLPTGVDLLVVDSAVNIGISRTKIMAENTRDDIAIGAWDVPVGSPVWVELFIQTFSKKRISWYRFNSNRKAREKFLDGWIKRVELMAETARLMRMSEASDKSIEELKNMTDVPDVKTVETKAERKGRKK